MYNNLVAWFIEGIYRYNSKNSVVILPNKDESVAINLSNCTVLNEL